MLAPACQEPPGGGRSRTWGHRAAHQVNKSPFMGSGGSWLCRYPAAWHSGRSVGQGTPCPQGDAVAWGAHVLKVGYGNRGRCQLLWWAVTWGWHWVTRASVLAAEREQSGHPSTPHPCTWGWLSPCSPTCHQGDWTGPFRCSFVPTRCGELRRGPATMPDGQCCHYCPSPMPGVPSQVSHHSSACPKEPQHEAGVPPGQPTPYPCPTIPASWGN